MPALSFSHVLPRHLGFAAVLCGALFSARVQAGDILVQDDFKRSEHSIDASAPAHGSGAWMLQCSEGAGISVEDGAALINVPTSDTPPWKTVLATLPVNVGADSILILEAVMEFDHPQAQSWAGFGFTSSPTNGGNSPKNVGGPWMILYLPQTDMDRPLRGKCFYGETSSKNGFNDDPKANFDGPAGKYAAAITLRIQLNTKLKEVAYYVDDREVARTAIPELDIQYIFFQGFNTGDAVRILAIKLLSQPA